MALYLLIASYIMISDFTFLTYLFNGVLLSFRLSLSSLLSSLSLGKVQFLKRFPRSSANSFLYASSKSILTLAIVLRYYQLIVSKPFFRISSSMVPTLINSDLLIKPVSLRLFLCSKSFKTQLSLFYVVSNRFQNQG